MTKNIRTCRLCLPHHAMQIRFQRGNEHAKEARQGIKHSLALSRDTSTIKRERLYDRTRQLKFHPNLCSPAQTQKGIYENKAAKLASGLFEILITFPPFSNRSRLAEITNVGSTLSDNDLHGPWCPNIISDVGRILQFHLILVDMSRHLPSLLLLIWLLTHC